MLSKSASECSSAVIKSASEKVELGMTNGDIGLGDRGCAKADGDRAWGRGRGLCAREDKERWRDDRRSVSGEAELAIEGEARFRAREEYGGDVMGGDKGGTGTAGEGGKLNGTGTGELARLVVGVAGAKGSYMTCVG